jgi:hypothetical protein
MDAKLNDAGALEGTATYSARGDVEYFLRAGFRVISATFLKAVAAFSR